MAYQPDVAEEICKAIFHCSKYDLLEHIIDYAVEIDSIVRQNESVPRLRFFHIAGMKHGPEHSFVINCTFGFHTPTVTRITTYKFGKKHGPETDLHSPVSTTVRHFYNDIQVGKEIMYVKSNPVIISIITPSGNLFTLEDTSYIGKKVTTEINGDVQIRRTIHELVSMPMVLRTKTERYKNYIPHGLHEEKNPDGSIEKLYDLGVLIEEKKINSYCTLFTKYDGINKIVKKFTTSGLLVEEQSYTNGILNGPYWQHADIYGVQKCTYVNGLYHGEVVEKIIVRGSNQARIATFDHGILHGKTTIKFNNYIWIEQKKVNYIVLNYNNGILQDAIAKWNDEIIYNVKVTDYSPENDGFIKYIDDQIIH